MRIGVDASCWSNRRGFGRFTRELLTALARLDRATEYVFFTDAATAATHAFPRSVELVEIETAVSPVEAASGTGRRALADVWAMTRAVRGERLDLFFFPAVYSYFPVLNRRMRVVVTIHDVIAATHPDLVFGSRRTARFWRWKEALARKQADMILTVSAYSRETITRRFRLPPDRVRTISEAAGPAFTPGVATADALRKCGLSAGDRYLLYVGAITPYKNLSALVDAYATLAARPTHDDLRLLLVGDYENDPSFFNCHAELAADVRARGLADRVTFAGFVPDADLVHVYRGAAAFVLPSVEEGFGLTALEALACATPVAVSRRGSLPEVVGDAGVFFDPDDPDDVAVVIDRVLTDAVLTARLRERGPARAASFTWDAAARAARDHFSALAR